MLERPLGVGVNKIMSMDSITEYFWKIEKREELLFAEKFQLIKDEESNKNKECFLTFQQEVNNMCSTSLQAIESTEMLKFNDRLQAIEIEEMLAIDVRVKRAEDFEIEAIKKKTNRGRCGFLLNFLFASISYLVLTLYFKSIALIVLQELITMVVLHGMGFAQ